MPTSRSIMKTSSYLTWVLSAALLVSCTQTPVVQVVDSKSKLPVAGASVKAVSGNYYSGTNITDADGVTMEPAFPGGASELEIKRSGYQTTRVKY